ncbi:MAG: hypothetical protein JKY65_27070 [Planctomycetes bacterium]|nr:hypothetical protein [Planctomycetota bacterium]
MSEPAPQPEPLTAGSEAPSLPVPPANAVTGAEAPGAALEEAVALALRVLQGVTLVLLLMFLGSGVFTVESNQVAFVKRLGNLDETPLGPGLHWRWQVLDEVVRVEKTSRTEKILSFDLQRTKEALKGEETRSGGLDPEREGALLSGDAALVHVSLAIRYAARAPFLRSENRFNVRAGDVAEGDQDRERAIRALVERAAVHAAAGREVEGLLGAEKGEFLTAVGVGTQDAFDFLEAGLEVKGIDLEHDLRPPPQVREAFALVTQSTQRVDLLRSQASAAATRIENQGIVGAAKIEGDARAEAFGITADSEALVKKFEALLPEYRRSPRAVRQRLLAQTLADALAEVGEAFLVGDGELRIRLKRDTRTKRAALKADARRRLGIGGN